MGIGAISAHIIGNDRYTGRIQLPSADSECSRISSAQAEPEKTAEGLGIHTIYEKLKNGTSKIQNTLESNKNSLIAQASGNFAAVENDRYVIQKSDSIAGYWEIYDKELDSHAVFNPNWTNIQTDPKTNKNYLIEEEPGYGFCSVQEVPDALMSTLETFMGTNTVRTDDLDKNYIIHTDPTTGIDAFTVAGKEGFYASMLITDKAQMARLQELADVYQKNYPNLVTSKELALHFASGEVMQFNVRTPNGILQTSQFGMTYMDDQNSNRDWSVVYEQSSDTYKKILDAVKNGAVPDLEQYQSWQEWFADAGITYTKVLTDEELAELLVKQR